MEPWQEAWEALRRDLPTDMHHLVGYGFRLGWEAHEQAISGAIDRAGDALETLVRGGSHDV